ncbi:ABC transporter ATP-binding protein [Bosea sp. (in: a-proteobacteria)]|uniref:ABC transporter ATP-binding protein n=1 Tax=Bosea sp. (in: a-proteobacteria) TaxID=1871050 RepID=UPI00262C7E68|nr:ABC transporter ATP-binding protein [Bosea sp. (in: a-proteobacteria)]MCO5089516.1 ABC transporter ATP-binding protein [Bosea sp. (in: a-proteobacteria)]
MNEASTSPAVAISGLTVTFARRIGAVRGVDLTLNRGEAVALIGESGSGKSVTLRAIMRLNSERAAATTGVIEVYGRDVLRMSKRELSDFRGGEVAMIFQDPALALDPVYTVGEQIIEAIRRHEPMSRAKARLRALEMLERVRIPSPAQRLDAYPHEMSGGMRQRAMIALALSCRPRVLLADEPTTALDATVQIQVLLLLRDLQKELGLATVFVTHDLGAAVEVADRIAVMYAGRIVERGTAEEVILAPRHPYTIGLLRSRADGAFNKGARLTAIPGSPPDLSNTITGCAFAPRCWLAAERCRREQPPPLPSAGGHDAACWRAEEAAASYRETADAAS